LRCRRSGSSPRRGGSYRPASQRASSRTGMIEDHWKLERRAFANTPDPTFIYRSPSFAEGYARLLYDATDLRGGLSLITGEIGCGKTMLVQALAEKLAGGPCDVVTVPYPRV